MKSTTTSSSTLALVDTLLRPKRRRGNKRAKWLPEELAAFKPPERLTVSEWADKNRILDARTSAQPGRWRTDYTPYLREVMNTCNDPQIEEVVFCCASQVGKSECLNNIIAYVADQEPSPMLVVYPTIELAEWTSENRLQPMLRLSAATANVFRDRQSKRLELQFRGMYLALSGANSPASLASRPVRFVLFDECDKYPDASAREADPISLGEERTKTFWHRKIYKTSTPTIEYGSIWQAFEAADMRKHFYVPCPHCGHYQRLIMPQVKWPQDERDPQRVRDMAWYECETCKHVIEDKHKAQMLRFGEWRTGADPPGRVRSVGYHLSSLYSPWLTWGDIAAEFLSSKDFPEKLRNFVNSWLGEPWRDKAHIMQSDIILKAAARHPRGTVPDGAVFLTAGIDVQLDHFWWTIRAWGADITSWLVDYGRAETWADLEEALTRRRYKSESGAEYIVALACLDSGYRTDEVYQWCSAHAEVARPTKGSSSRLAAPYNVTSLDKGAFKGLKLWIVDTHYFKDFISGRVRKPVDEPGAWMVTADCTREYAEHLTAQQRVVRQNRRTGRTVEEWVPVSSHVKDHLLDCEVAAAVAAEILGVRYVQRAGDNEHRQRRVISRGVTL